jgi:hypothetical protein
MPSMSSVRLAGRCDYSTRAKKSFTGRLAQRRVPDSDYFLTGDRDRILA